MSHVSSTLLPLLPGMRLSREEFLRRWEAMPELKRAELIDGVVHMPSPVSNPHARFDFAVHGWLYAYLSRTPGCQGGNSATWLMDTAAPQPDSHLLVLPEYGGQARSEPPYLVGAPELAVEICYTSQAQDLGPKLALYQRAGVREYLTVLLDESRVVWRARAASGVFEVIAADADGLLRSRVFPGLWLNPAALLAEDAQALLGALQQGLASPEHAAFVAELARRCGLPDQDR